MALNSPGIDVIDACSGLRLGKICAFQEIESNIVRGRSWVPAQSLAWWRAIDLKTAREIKNEDMLEGVTSLHLVAYNAHEKLIETTVVGSSSHRQERKSD